MNEIILTPLAEKILCYDGYENPNGCLEWLGTIRKGYGRIQLKNGWHTVHRVAWVMYYGTQPKNLICHYCNNRSCYKKQHLYEGTYSTNNYDAYNFGNKIPPIPKPLVLTKEKYLQVKQLYLTNCYTQAELGVKFNVSTSTINLALNKKGGYSHYPS